MTQSQSPAHNDLISAKLFAALESQAQQRRIARVVVGIVYTAVQLDDGATGVALTLQAGRCCGGKGAFAGLDAWVGAPAIELLQGLRARDPVAVAVGLACANALANRADPTQREGDVRVGVEVASDDTVAMIGYFRPLEADLRAKAKALHIFDLVDAPQGAVRPSAEAEGILPHCDIALVTATTLVNRSIDQVLHWARHCRAVVLLGASTPLLPQVFAGSSVTGLAGVLVEDSDKVFQVVSEAGGMSRFKKYLRKVNVEVASLSPGILPTAELSSR